MKRGRRGFVFLNLIEIFHINKVILFVPDRKECPSRIEIKEVEA
jgi:hypothetical protein